VSARPDERRQGQLGVGESLTYLPDVAVAVVPYSNAWPHQFADVKRALESALIDVEVVSIEHVGSTSVPGLAAKPILDIDVIVEALHMRSAIAAIESVGYVQATSAWRVAKPSTPLDDRPRRNVYVCAAGTLGVRNHLAVRDVLRRRDDLRAAYAAVKLELAADPTNDLTETVFAAEGLTSPYDLRLWRQVRQRVSRYL
jgi:GrpB-like predicted nucleotidyltransferase (UPF0157 family)